jgi:hypothetical protein
MATPSSRLRLRLSFGKWFRLSTHRTPRRVQTSVKLGKWLALEWQRVGRNAPRESYFAAWVKIRLVFGALWLAIKTAVLIVINYRGIF